MYAVSTVSIEPVSVRVGVLSARRIAATVEDLMGMLMSDHWPEKTSLEFNIAMSACIKAIALLAGGDKARKAFLEAAHGAGLFSRKYAPSEVVL